MQKKLLAVAMIGLVSFAGMVNAKTVRLSFTNVVDTTVSSNSYGGCLAQVAMNVSTLAPACPGTATSSYVVFACDGSLQNADAANQLFETVQMGQMLGKQVRLYVDDAKKISGYCMVNRVDIK